VGSWQIDWERGDLGLLRADGMQVVDILENDRELFFDAVLWK
jgi:hypothetical protein